MATTSLIVKSRVYTVEECDKQDKCYTCIVVSVELGGYTVRFDDGEEGHYNANELGEA